MKKNKAKKNGRVNILLKVKTEQKNVFQRQASKYTEGNVALWLRTAGQLQLTAAQRAQVKRQMAS